MASASETAQSDVARLWATVAGAADPAMDEEAGASSDAAGWQGWQEPADRFTESPGVLLPTPDAHPASNLLLGPPGAPPGQGSGTPAPGGLPARVSTQPWSLGAAMEPLGPTAPRPVRSSRVSRAEPTQSGTATVRTAGMSLPFPVLATGLVLILVAIIILIVVDFRS
jgi:hypothetical protein